MELSIDKIFELLSWSSSKEHQQLGIAEAKKIKNLSVLIRPVESKLIWENCAIVLSSKNDDELTRYLPEMFQWLQDMNWPGAETIYGKLVGMPRELIHTAHSVALDQATKLEDKPWLAVLETFSF